MGILNKTKTYLVGLMQYGDGSIWRNDISPFLSDLGVTVFDPFNKPFVESFEENDEVRAELKESMLEGNFSKVREHMKQVRALDLNMVDKSDFIIAYIDPDIPTYGTTEEISWATRMRKPVLTVIKGGVNNTPLWLTAMMPREQFFDNFIELCAYLEDIDKGRTEVNHKYWRLLRDEFR